MNPIHTFEQWYREEIEKSALEIPAACCLTSIGLDGYPNSRFVSLKGIVENKFVITGSLESRKGIELLQNPKASLVFWWTKTQRQVRIQGDTTPIEDALANAYFKERNKPSQLVSTLFDQGASIENIAALKIQFEQKKSDNVHTEIPRPASWSGFYILPKRIEFMQFEPSRFHLRELFTREKDGWNRQYLQP